METRPNYQYAHINLNCIVHYLFLFNPIHFQKILRDDRFHRGIEPEDDSLWMPSQLLCATASVMYHLPDTQVNFIFYSPFQSQSKVLHRVSSKIESRYFSCATLDGHVLIVFNQH